MFFERLKKIFNKKKKSYKVDKKKRRKIFELGKILSGIFAFSLFPSLGRAADLSFAPKVLPAGWNENTKSLILKEDGSAVLDGQLVANGAGPSITAANGITGDLTGNAATATRLKTARAIGGVSFDGTADINLPGVNTTGNQDTTGNAATATTATNATNATNADRANYANYAAKVGYSGTCVQLLSVDVFGWGSNSIPLPPELGDLGGGGELGSTCQ